MDKATVKLEIILNVGREGAEQFTQDLVEMIAEHDYVTAINGLIEPTRGASITD